MPEDTGRNAEKKMKVMVSACDLGENCKYNGGNNYSERLMAFLKEQGINEKDIIPVCPEVLGGLSIPRYPCEICDGKVVNSNGEDVDKEFRLGAQLGLKLAVKENVELVILQSRSPSCGVGLIYDGTFSGSKISGNGVFAQLLIDNGIEVVDVACL